MSLKRGDIGLARFPHASGTRGKKRPVVVVQADVYNQTLRQVVVAEVTGNLSGATDAANLLIDVSTPDGHATGLAQDSLVTCVWLATIAANRIEKVVGKLSDAMKQQLNACLKAALELP